MEAGGSLPCGTAKTLSGLQRFGREILCILSITCSRRSKPLIARRTNGLWVSDAPWRLQPEDAMADAETHKFLNYLVIPEDFGRRAQLGRAIDSFLEIVSRCWRIVARARNMRDFT